MNVSIFGLGYVGCVTAACLARQSHNVIGVDVVDAKVDAVNSGRWPIFEPGLEEMLKTVRGKVSATRDSRRAILSSQMTLVCVGTPSFPDGDVDTTHLRKTVAQIARILKAHPRKRHDILIRSTVPPGTCEELVLPLLSPAQRKRTAFYPEFLREGSAIRDFFDPSLNVIGAGPGYSAAAAKRLLPQIKQPLEIVSIRTAEAIKYANNAFHALKIAFTNEFALFCKSRGADADEVMNLFCRDSKLNLSPYYLRPGFAFGGSCLPKELRALIAGARNDGHHATLFDATLRSNENMVRALVSLVYRLKHQSVGYVGITFKPNTDDLRESPILHAAGLLNGPSPTYRRRIRQYAFDGPKSISRLLELESASYLLPVGSLRELVRLCDVIVLGPQRLSSAEERMLARSEKSVIDLKWFRVGDVLRRSKRYHSLV